MTTEIKTAPSGASSVPGRAPMPGKPGPRPLPPRRDSRQLRPQLSLAGAGVLAAVCWTLWQTTASRLSLFVCAATLATAAVDVVWAIVATGRVQISVTANTPEATVGERVAVSLAVTGPRQYLDLRVPGLATAVERIGVDVPGSPVVVGTVLARGVFSTTEVDFEGRGLAGLVKCDRRRTVPLRPTAYVGPRVVPSAEPFPELYRIWGEGQARPSPEGDLVRGVRPYLPGDPMRKVHWRATARDLSGDLVVKEVEETGAPRLVIVVDLDGGGEAAERAAGRAAWYAGEGLRRSYHVILATAELARVPGADGPTAEHQRRSVAVTGPVESPSDVIRRLAAASTLGKPDLPPADKVGGVVVITARGDSWR